MIASLSQKVASDRFSPARDGRRVSAGDEALLYTGPATGLGLPASNLTLGSLPNQLTCLFLSACTNHLVFAFLGRRGDW